MRWLMRLFSGRQPQRPPPAAGLRVSQPAPSPPEPLPAAAAADAPVLLSWLLGCGAPVATALSTEEQRALDRLDEVLALPTLPDELLPRASALIPQLLATLRQTELPVSVLAQRVAKDVVLAAEVLRLAGSPYYRAQGQVTDLQQAIALIGVEGLQTVIARVVLKPMYGAATGALSSMAGSRVGEHAEALAQQASLLCSEVGASRFDGFVAGLLCDSGWTILLRVLDRSRFTPVLPPSAAFAAACEERAYRLFGLASQRWAISPGFGALVEDARAQALATSRQPLATVLRRALPLATSTVVAAAAAA